MAFRRVAEVVNPSFQAEVRRLVLFDVQPERSRALVSWERVSEEEDPAIVRALGVLQAVVLELKSLKGFALKITTGLRSRCADASMKVLSPIKSSL